MDRISLTNTADLRSKAQDVKTIADEFETTMAQAEQNVNGVLENWKDDNGKVFEEKYLELSSEFKKCKENIRIMGELIDKEARQIDEMLAQEQQELNAARNA